MNTRTTLVMAMVALAFVASLAGARPGSAHGNAASSAAPVRIAQQSTAVPPAPTAPGGAPAAGPSARSMAGPIIGVALVFMASAVGFGFALGLRRRINAIAGPEPEDEDEL